MYKGTRLLALIIFTLAGATLLLGGCHTVAGAGEDISHTGKVIEKSADKNTP